MVKPSGLGLGFFIAKTLLERSGATISLDNRERPQRGAIVKISWPREVFERKQAAAAAMIEPGDRLQGADLEGGIR